MKFPQILIFAGLTLVVTGILLYFFPGILNWIGKLPGDIKIVKENSKTYIPVTSMIIISIVLTVLLNIAMWIFTKFK